MTHRARRWLFHRRNPTLQPLYQRTSWYDFEGRMRVAIAIDMQILLGEVTRAELLDKQRTRPVPTLDHDAPTLAVEQHWIYADETERVEIGSIDQHATLAMEEVAR